MVIHVEKVILPSIIFAGDYHCKMLHYSLTRKNFINLKIIPGRNTLAYLALPLMTKKQFYNLYSSWSCPSRTTRHPWSSSCPMNRGQCYKTFSVRDLQIFVLNQSICQTRLEKLTNDKHSSLLQKSVIYGQKSFITLGRSASEMLRSS